MGTPIEINDTLKLNRDQGMPEVLVVGQRFSFRREGERLYHRAPTRVFLVEDRNGKWIWRGHGVIWEQTIHATTHETTGVVEVIKVYSEQYSRMITPIESQEGKSLDSMF